MEQAQKTPQKAIIVCGGGLSGHMTAVYLSQQLSASQRIIFLPNFGSSSFDFMYGGATSPTAYEFLRRIGLDEPNLIQNAAASFSLGTHIQQWPNTASDWVQCHHLPLPALNSVPFQHHLSRDGSDLQSLLVSAAAAKSGKFAHPPQDTRVPLSRAEYGYQFEASQIVRLLEAELLRSGVQIRTERVEEVDVSASKVVGLILESGDRLQGDLFIDCSGPERRLLSALNASFSAKRQVSASAEFVRTERLGPPARRLSARPEGWQIETHVQGGVAKVSVAADDGQDTVTLGRVEQAWIGNCVGLGQSAYVMEPLSPAPMMLLQADIERFLELIPVSNDCDMERREYNRRFKDDVSHASLFQDALLMSPEAFQTPFWEEAVASAHSDALERKIVQFEHRGLLVKYDLEPFNDEDWLILHSGMGRTPKQTDRQVERVALQDTQRQFAGLQSAIQQIVSRMPPHHDYVVNLKRYLEKQKHG